MGELAINTQEQQFLANSLGSDGSFLSSSPFCDVMFHTKPLGMQEMTVMLPLSEWKFMSFVS